MNRQSWNRGLVLLGVTAILLVPAVAMGGNPESTMFLGERNLMVGSGGELLVKAEHNNGGDTVIEVGDILIGIGVNHFVESLEQPPGLDAFHPNAASDPQPVALRAMRATTKDWSSIGVVLTFEPLSPIEYSQLISKVTDGRVSIDATSIPEGTFIMSFLDEKRSYTLRALEDSPAVNIARVASSKRQWNVGVGKETDFWMAEFPSDDISILSELTRDTVVGNIRFGLSLLPGSVTSLRFERKAECVGPTGQGTSHDFCLSGSARGVKGFDTAFPIGLQTQIVAFPVEK